MDDQTVLIVSTLVTLCGGLALLLYNAFSSSVSRIMSKLDTVEEKVDEHNASSIQRLSKVETKVDSIVSTVEDLDKRVRHIEMRRA
jgi:outer membrane murein-binding lipoprotein Lpp